MLQRTTLLVSVLALTAVAPASFAQVERPSGPPEAERPAAGSFGPGPVIPPAGPRRTILLTGYWPPSNEAVRPFSPNPAQNPAGWIGQNWENRGYDVVSYFPEFNPPTCSSCGQGTGDMEVDYQDSSNDFWAIANALQPIAIVTFSRTNANLSWELEQNSVNFASWTADFSAPTQPTPVPPDASVPAGTVRVSTQPMQEIVDDVSTANLGLNPFICTAVHAGSFVSGFAAYHGSWYQALHASPMDPAWCVSGGHIHVGDSIPWDIARKATEVTLRTVIRNVDRARFGCNDVLMYCQTTANSVGTGAVLSPAGSNSLAQNNLRLVLTNATHGAPALPIVSLTRGSTPWGNGTRCIGTPFARVGQIQSTNAQGFLDRAIQLQGPLFTSGPYALAPGSTVRFQIAYRDAAAGGATFDTSNGVEITFCP